MPGGDIPFLLAGATLVVINMLFVIVRIITRLILKLRKRPDVVPAFAGWRLWILCAVAIFAMGLAGALGVPFRLAFAVSRPQLDQLVEAYNIGQLPKGNLWAGLFPIASVSPIENGLKFTFRKDEFPWGKRGIYYSDSGERIEISSRHQQKRIGSKWFSWHYGGW